MKKLFQSADLYLAESSWKDLALITFCLFSMGILIAGFLPEEKKKPVRFLALLVFIGTYVPLMAKYFRVMKVQSVQEEAE